MSLVSKWEKLLEDTSCLYVYGAGKIGKKILKLIDSCNQKDKIKGIIVSDNEGSKNPKEINNIPVIELKYIDDKDCTIFVSVADCYQVDVFNLLESRDFKNFINVYPYSFIGTEEVCTETPDSILMDVRELLCQQYLDGEFYRYDVFVRMFAIKDFHLNENYWISRYKKMQETRLQENNISNYGEKAWNRFLELIKSMDEKGYDTDSEIVVDRNFKLQDGAHRLACALYYDVKQVRVRILTNSNPVDYGIDWFRKYFSDCDCKFIENYRFDNEKNWILPIKGILWPPADSIFEEIQSSIQNSYELTNIQDFYFSSRNFPQYLKSIYSIDDIAAWKVQKKLENMLEKDTYHVRTFDINMGIPDFRLKRTGTTLSHKGEKLKKEIREKFSNKIENYYYDVIFHTADNYYQSKFMDSLVNVSFSLRPFFESIKDCRWMIIKYDSDIYPNDFSDNFPRFNDVDIIAHPDDMEDIVQKAYLFFEKITSDDVTLKKIEDSFKTKIRIELQSELILLMDISCNEEKLSKEFIVDSLNRREFYDGYFLAKREDEFIFRYVELLKNPTKLHHKMWLEINKDLINKEYLDGVLTKK